MRQELWQLVERPEQRSFCFLFSGGRWGHQCTVFIMTSSKMVGGWILHSGCLSHCSIAVKRHYDQDNSYKRKHLTGGLPTVRFRSREPGGTQARMVLEQ